MTYFLQYADTPMNLEDIVDNLLARKPAYRSPYITQSDNGIGDYGIAAVADALHVNSNLKVSHPRTASFYSLYSC
jgi:hypothetical protein